MLRRSSSVVLGLCALPALAQAQPVADRYGAAPQAYAATPVGARAQGYAAPSASGPPAGGSARVRLLSWPGKTTPVAALAPPAAQYAAPRAAQYAAPRQAGFPTQGYARTAAPAAARPQLLGAPAYAAAPAAAPPAPRQTAYAAPQAAAAPAADQGWRPVFAPPAAARTAPSSIYAGMAAPSSARAAAAPPPNRAAAQRYGYDPTVAHAVRFYSVGRPFGLRPDPAPIPPQFFTASADLAAPPADAPTERTATTTASGSRTVRAVPDTTVN